MLLVSLGFLAKVPTNHLFSSSVPAGSNSLIYPMLCSADVLYWFSSLAAPPDPTPNLSMFSRFRWSPSECPPGSSSPRDKQHGLRVHVPVSRLHRAHPPHLHMRRLEKRGLRFLRRRFRGPHGDPEGGPEIPPRGSDLLGDRVRGTEPTGRLHADQRV